MKKRRRKKKHCAICKKFFNPIHRLGVRQITCGDSACRNERKKRYDSSWHRRNRDLHNQEISDWFREHRQERKEYMRSYRLAKGL